MTRWPPAPDLPFLVYSFPVAAPAIAGGPQAIELCGLKNVIGLKFTAHGFYKLSLIRNTGADVFNGYDEVLAVQARVNELIEFTIRYAYFQGAKPFCGGMALTADSALNPAAGSPMPSSRACAKRCWPRRSLIWQAERQAMRQGCRRAGRFYRGGTLAT